MTVPKALVTDYGGVLTTSIFDSFKRFCLDNDVSVQRLKDVLTSGLHEGVPDPDHPTHQIELGKISATEFNAYLSAGLSEGRSEPIDPKGLKDRLFESVRPEPSMVFALSSLRSAGFKVALCSNSWGGDGYPREAFDSLFDVAVLSGEVGLRKPQPEIYQKACDDLGIAAQECLFVDDLNVNVEGAKAVGMMGLLHLEPDQTIAQLQNLFEISLADDSPDMG